MLGEGARGEGGTFEFSIVRPGLGGATFTSTLAASAMPLDVPPAPVPTAAAAATAALIVSPADIALVWSNITHRNGKVTVGKLKSEKA